MAYMNLAASQITGTSSIPTSFAWNVNSNATGNLTLANAGYTSTFNQTSAVAWLGPPTGSSAAASSRIW